MSEPKSQSKNNHKQNSMIILISPQEDASEQKIRAETNYYYFNNSDNDNFLDWLLAHEHEKLYNLMHVYQKGLTV